MIGDGCIISEKAVVGGPLPNNSESSDNGNLKKATVIENNVRLDPHAMVHHSATILEGPMVEGHATLLPGAVVGGTVRYVRV